MTELVRLKYGYDRSSNRLYRRDEVARSDSASFDELYGYGGLNRVVSFAGGSSIAATRDCREARH